MKLAVIGTGNMGRALLGGFVNGGVISPSDAWCLTYIRKHALSVLKNLV